ncbi:MAG: FAD-binding oxidoreductase, partial [Gemmatimonadetes bacterium]|nr:FAD-binding oxidoreductase [Gemmatimonadota bacterium]
METTSPDARAGAAAESLPAEADVVVIGGGIAGASTLYHLAEAGVDALLLERGSVGGGATSAAVGILSPPVRQPFHEMSHSRGVETASRIWRFALDSVRTLGEALEAEDAEEATELDLSGGTVLAEPHTQHEVREAFQALSQAGFPVRWIDAATVRDEVGGRGFTGGYLIEGLGSMHPGEVARVLVDAACARSAALREGVTVERVVDEDNRHLCVTDRGEVRARSVVFAAHTGGAAFVPLVREAVVPVLGQALSGRIVGEGRFRGAFATDRKLNVWRSTPEGRLALSGWRHDAWDRAYRRTRSELDRHLQDDLEAWFSQAFPHIRLTDVSRWSGIFGWTADYLPMVGSLGGPGSRVVVAGFSGGGLPFAFRSGLV